MLTGSIRWEVFTRQEKENIKKAMDKADYKIFTNLINEITPEKEAELEKLVALYRSQSEGYESEVRKDMETSFLNKPTQDMTPKEEAEWQKKLDDEKEKMSNKSQKTEKVVDEVKSKIGQEIDDSLKENEEAQKAKKEEVSEVAKVEEEKKDEAVKKAEDEARAKDQKESDEAIAKLDAEEQAEGEANIKAEADAKAKTEADAKKVTPKAIPEIKKVEPVKKITSNKTETKKVNK